MKNETGAGPIKKIAIIHDDFTISGGAEKLVALLARGLTLRGIPTDIITFDISEKIRKIIPEGVKIGTLNHRPLEDKCKIIRKCLFSQLDIRREYNFFIFSGRDSLCAAKKHKPNLYYCHNIPRRDSHFLPKSHLLMQKTPELIRECLSEKIWLSLYSAKNRFVKTPLPETIAESIDIVRFLFANSLNPVYFKYILYLYRPSGYKENIRHCQRIISNSNNIQAKVKQAYGRDSKVIYPPVEVETYNCRRDKNYWISINRIVPLKRIELQLRAFSKLPAERLFIIGDITENKLYYEELEKIRPENVSFLGVVGDKELKTKLSDCSGLVFTAADEDFGMAPVEAMASGKPVIAANEGGLKETVINGVTGKLIDNINEEKLIQAIREIGKSPEQYKDACLEQAKKFDTKIFIKRIEREIEKILLKRASGFRETADILTC